MALAATEAQLLEALERAGARIEALERVYVVWRGHRDYEENVVVCETREIAELCLRNYGVGPDDPAGDRVDAAGVPWGIDECEFVRAMWTPQRR